ncbi:30S ribosomal protein S10 [Candidatus Pacearchaeota archaeon ex4484_31]|nr:MAG: 30S ribosomal protein S10 [Candidatus Pacearchaeota archaeon ex4484_31]
MARTRIKLASTNIEKLNEVVNTICEIASKSGIAVKGPIPLPTKRLRITVRKSPCGDGKATFDRFEMRIHKRLIEMPADTRTLHNIMRLPISKEVNIEIKVIEE